MWRRATRVEFIIVSVALLVLLLCSDPPKPGKADIENVRGPGGTWPAEQVRSDSESPQVGEDEPSEAPSAEPIDDDEPNEVVLEVSKSEDAGSSQRMARLAAVDARNCNNLNYKNVMYGKVTVRWIWNGTQFVPQKVCVVEEEDGSSSVWSFDQQDEAVLSEITAQPGSSQ